MSVLTVYLKIWEALKVAASYTVLHPLLYDIAAALACWFFGVSTTGFYWFVPLVPAAWLLFRVISLRRRLAPFIAPTPKP